MHVVAESRDVTESLRLGPHLQLCLCVPGTGHMHHFGEHFVLLVLVLVAVSITRMVKKSILPGCTAGQQQNE